MRYLFFFVATMAFAQEPIYTARCTASSACTIQQPASPSKTIQLIRAMVKCPTACTVELEHNSTGASATEVTPAATSPAGVNTATAKVYKNSNVASGTVISNLAPATGSDYAISFEAGTNLNRTTGLSYTVRPSTSDATIIWMWREK